MCCLDKFKDKLTAKALESIVAANQSENTTIYTDRAISSFRQNDDGTTSLIVQVPMEVKSFTNIPIKKNGKKTMSIIRSMKETITKEMEVRIH